VGWNGAPIPPEEDEREVSPARRRRRIRSKSDDEDEEGLEVVERGSPFAERFAGVGAVRPIARTALRVANRDVPMYRGADVPD
jgi:hypothetical protein